MKLTKNVVFLAVTAVALVTNAASINEVRISQPGADTDNYWELAGGVGESLAGLSLITVSGEFNPGLIEFAYDLDSFTIDDGFFLGHQTDASAEIVTGDDYFGSPTNFLLVSGFTGMAGDDIDTDDDGVPEVTPWTSVLDGVFLVDSDMDMDFPYGGPMTVGPDGTFAPAHAYRDVDATGAWVIGDFSDLSFDTPGASNVVPEPSVALLTLLSCLSLSMLRRK